MRTIFALGVALVFAATATAQDDAMATIKKAIEAHGGSAALAKAQKGRATSKGTMTVSGQDIDFTATSIYDVPQKFKLEIAAELSGLKLTTLQVLNGNKTKIKTVLAGTEQPSNDRVKEETLQAGLLQEVSSLIPLVAEKSKYTIKADKPIEVGGSPAAVVIVSGNGLRETRLAFDKKTGYLVQTSRKGVAPGPSGIVEVTEETTISDFEKNECGVMVGKKVNVTQDGKKFMTMTLTKFEALEKIDPAEFAIDS